MCEGAAEAERGSREAVVQEAIEMGVVYAWLSICSVGLSVCLSFSLSVCVFCGCVQFGNTEGRLCSVLCAFMEAGNGFNRTQVAQEPRHFTARLFVCFR